MDGRLIIVTGPPGSGKSTIARSLARAWPAPAALHIHSDDLWTYFVKGYIPPWTPPAADQNAVVMRAMAAQGAALAAGGYPVMFDGVVGTWFLDPYRDAAQAAGARLDYLVLRPDRETTIARGVARESHPMRDPAVIGAMWDQFADMGALEPHVLDTTALSLGDSLAAALEGLQADRFRLT